ncbi:MAG: hypothetical protein U9N55_05975 [candidate division Zixibacteria bacterium]|nr:hypothetical protein [candidate division Zixibacteria bacterium]
MKPKTEGNNMISNRGNRKRKTGEPFYKSSFFKFTTKILMGGVVIVMFLTLAQCTVKKPESPTWTTQLVVPVVNRTYQMDEIVDKIGDNNLDISNSGIVTLSITEDLDTVLLDQDNLTTDDLYDSLSKQLGLIDIDPPSVEPISVSLSEISELATPLSGDIAIVPNTSFGITTEIPSFSTFTTATFSTGSVDVIITNKLGTSLDTISVDLVVNDSTIASGTHPSTLNNDSSAIITLDLAGKTVPDNVKIASSYHHIFVDTITEFSTRYISTDMEFSDILKVTEATAQIPGLSISDSSTVTLGEDDRIDTASLTSGNLGLAITNQTALDANLTITVPDIIDTLGLPMTIGPTPVPASQTIQIDQSLIGCYLIPQSSTVPQELSINVIADIDGSGTEQKTVSSTNSVLVSSELTNLTFGSVTGQFQTVSVTFDSISEDVEIPTGFENIEFVNAVITLEIENGINLPGDVSIQLSGDNGKSLNMTGDIAPRGMASSVTSEITNAEVADFLSPIPTHIEASGTVTFGDGTYQGTITGDDYVFAKVKIDAPLEMIINESEIDMDIERQTIEQKDIDKITDHFIEGHFVYRLVNHLPVGAHVNIYLDSDSLQLNSDSAQLSFDSLYVTAAETDANGIVIDTMVMSPQTISLDSAQIRILENDTLYIGSEITLHGSDSQAVKLMGNDFITVNGHINVEYIFDGEF